MSEDTTNIQILSSEEIQKSIQEMKEEISEILVESKHKIKQFIEHRGENQLKSKSWVSRSSIVVPCCNKS